MFDSDLEISVFPLAGCGPVFKYLTEKHQELKTMNIDAVYSLSSFVEDEDEILLSVFSVINMRTVYITGIRMTTGEVLAQLRVGIPNLEKLNLVKCSALTDLGIYEILRISGTSLRELSLAKSCLTGIKLKNKEVSLVNLEKLDLQGCSYLTNIGLWNIIRIYGENLKELNLSETIITGIFPEQGRVCLPNLEKLNLHKCSRFTDKGLERILSMCGSNLRELDLSETGLVECTFESDTVELPNIEILNLSRCSKLTYGGFSRILKLCQNSLRALYLQETGTTRAGFQDGFDFLPLLEKLSLKSWHNLRISGLNEILRISGSSLIELDLSEIKTTGIGFGSGLNSLPNLEKLNLGHQSTLEDQGIREILQTVGDKLKQLNISATNISGVGFNHGSICFPNLEILTLEYCFNLTDKGLPDLLSISGSKLRELYLSGSRITGKGLKKKLRPLPNLEILGLIDCRTMTKRGLKEIMKMYGSTVKSVYVHGAKMSPEQFEKVQRRYASVQSMTYRQFYSEVQGNPVF